VLGQGHYDQDDAADDWVEAEDQLSDQGPVEVGVSHDERKNGAWSRLNKLFRPKNS
jgi:hypothetical protein